MTLTITRSFEFDAAHRVLGHESKCKYLHGHRYKAEVSVSSPSLDGLGRVVDFGVVKNLVGGWIESHLDHNTLLHRDDPLLNMNPRNAVFGGAAPFVMPNGENPTAENLAALIYNMTGVLLTGQAFLTVRKVRVYETPNCWADYPS